MKPKPEQELFNSPNVDVVQFEAVETSYYLRLETDHHSNHQDQPSTAMGCEGEPGRKGVGRVGGLQADVPELLNEDNEFGRG